MNLEDQLVRAEKEKAHTIRAVIHDIMDRYPQTRTDKWLLFFHFARFYGIHIDWRTLDAFRSIPNPDQLMRRRREVIASYYPELRDQTDPRVRRAWRRAYYQPANQLNGY